MVLVACGQGRPERGPIRWVPRDLLHLRQAPRTRHRKPRSGLVIPNILLPTHPPLGKDLEPLPTGLLEA